MKHHKARKALVQQIENLKSSQLVVSVNVVIQSFTRKPVRYYLTFHLFKISFNIHLFKSKASYRIITTL